MKSLLNYVNKESQESQESQVPIKEEVDPEVKTRLDKVRKDIEKVLKSMDLGGLKYEIYPGRVTFELGRRYDFWIELDRFGDTDNLYFSSIASYGNFTTGDETYKFYKALGVLLSQEDKLEQLRQLFLEARNISRKL